MKFSELYNFANSGIQPNISVKALAEYVRIHHPHVKQVNFYPVDLDTSISLGHVKFERDRSSPYDDDEFTIANIRYARSLNRCWRRYVICKELMHVFDNSDEKVDSRDKYFRLMAEFESPPLVPDASPMHQSELRAQWMAFCCLIPKRLRDIHKANISTEAETLYAIALKLKMPEASIGSITSDYYDEVLERLLNL